MGAFRPWDFDLRFVNICHIKIMAKGSTINHLGGGVVKIFDLYQIYLMRFPQRM